MHPVTFLLFSLLLNVLHFLHQLERCVFVLNQSCQLFATPWSRLLVHRIFPVIILECVTISSSRRSSQSRNQIFILFIGRQIVYHGTTWETNKQMVVVVVVQSLSHVQLLQPHGLQLARLLGPWDFPDKNTGVGCRFLLQGKKQITACNQGMTQHSSSNIT